MLQFCCQTVREVSYYAFYLVVEIARHFNFNLKTLLLLYCDNADQILIIMMTMILKDHKNVEDRRIKQQ